MMMNPVDNRWLYNYVDYSLKAVHPISDMYYQCFKQLMGVSEHLHIPSNSSQQDLWGKFDPLTMSRQNLRAMAGYCYMYHMLLDTYHKPEFGIESVEIDGEYFDIVEEVVKKKKFCELLHFKKMEYDKPQPKILLVAPMSGHYATLLRETVNDMLPFYDVYITDWINARDVPLSDGSFDLNDYVHYMISLMHYLGKDLHIMAVCQSTVPVIVAIAAMEKAGDPDVPKTATLLGGPIDTSESPTAVNNLAVNRGESWFMQNVISIVPDSYPGYMRLVYPGFMQLSGFMSMNMERHVESMMKAVESFSKDDNVAAMKSTKFYAEYFSTMDLTAEFYMQTINSVFQEKLLMQGRYKFRGKNIDLRDIRNTGLLAIEGEKDDITGIGQTQAVLDHCQHIPANKKSYLLAKDVGHYGLFNGSKFRNIILPAIREFTDRADKTRH